MLEDGERFLEDERTQKDTKLRDKIPEEPEKNENLEKLEGEGDGRPSLYLWKCRQKKLKIPQSRQGRPQEQTE